MSFTIEQVNYNNKKHAEDLVFALNSYARDPMGGGEDLADKTKSTLCQALAKRSDAISFIAYSDSGDVIGLMNAFEGFSTFAAKPLINLHDVWVSESCRGKGLVKELFQKLIQEAKNRDCCKLTLEVLSNNTRAKKAYSKIGFKAYELPGDAGHAEFWQLKLG